MDCALLCYQGDQIKAVLAKFCSPQQMAELGGCRVDSFNWNGSIVYPQDCSSDYPGDGYKFLAIISVLKSIALTLAWLKSILGL